MQVPLLDLQRQYESIKEEVDRAIHEVLDSQYFVLGDTVKDFEEQIADYCGTEYAIGVASGTDSLLLSLRALGAGEGEEDMVITTPFTFFATAGAIVNAGAKPVFVDIKPDTFNIDPDRIEGLLAGKPELRENVIAILPVHLYGQVADMDAIMDIAEEYDIPVVEDACQAIGAEYKGKRAGSYGNTGGFSFFPTKNLGGYGDGGMVVTSNEELADKIRRLRVHGSTKTYHHKTVGYNSRLDAIQAAVLSVKLKYLEQWSKKRTENAEYYNRALSSVDWIETPVIENGRNHIFHQYTIRVKYGRRDELKEHLSSNNIGTKIYYPLSLHLQDCFTPLGYGEGDFPVAEKATEEVLSLPIFPELEEKELEYVVNTIHLFSRSRRRLR